MTEELKPDFDELCDHCGQPRHRHNGNMSLCPVAAFSFRRRRPSPDQAVIEKGWNRMLEAAIAEFEAKGMERAKGILAYHLNREVTQPALEAERKQG